MSYKRKKNSNYGIVTIKTLDRMERGVKESRHDVSVPFIRNNFKSTSKGKLRVNKKPN